MKVFVLTPTADVKQTSTRISSEHVTSLSQPQGTYRKPVTAQQAFFSKCAFGLPGDRCCASAWSSEVTAPSGESSLVCPGIRTQTIADMKARIAVQEHRERVLHPVKGQRHVPQKQHHKPGVYSVRKNYDRLARRKSIF